MQFLTYFRSVTPYWRRQNVTPPVLLSAYIVLFALTTTFRDTWVPVTTAWRFHRLRMEERPAIRRVSANILNKQSQTADKGWSCSLGVVRGTSRRKNWPCYQTVNTFLEPGLILRYDLSSGTGCVEWI